MTESMDVTPMTTDHNLIIRTGKSEAEVTTNKRLHSKFVLLQLSTDRHCNRAASLRQLSFLSQVSAIAIALAASVPTSSPLSVNVDLRINQISTVFVSAVIFL